jgi:flavin reductase
MAQLASAVSIAACWDGERPAGLLVSSLTPLSAEPPRILFCVQKQLRSHDAFLRADACSLHVLAEPDLDEARRFSDAHRHAERFDPAGWSLARTEPPRYRFALIALVGRIGHRIDAGTHSVFIVNLTETDVRDGAPLVYAQRRFSGLRPVDETAALAGLAAL